MLITHFKAFAVASVSLLMLCCTISRAANIPIVNPSFESVLDDTPASYDLPDASYVLFAGGVGSVNGGASPPAGTTVVGWTSVATSTGVYDVTSTTGPFVSNVSGENVFFVNTASESIRQDLTGTTLQVGTYVLTANAGTYQNFDSQNPTLNTDTYLVLNVNGVQPDVGVAGGASGFGTLSQITTTYTIAPGNANLGAELSVILARTAAGDSLYYDNVTLTFTPIPEPNSFALLALCVPALAMIRRRHKQAMRKLLP